MATFVLVHGAFHGGWCWKKVTPLLTAAGHDVYTPTLTGLGERIHLASPDVDLTTHIRDVVNVLEYEDLNEVVLVGHSYGGIVITGVAAYAAHRLAQLVYLDAMVPQDGQAMVDLIQPVERQDIEARVAADGDGWRWLSFRPVPWGVFVREGYGVTDEADVKWMAARLCPQPFKTLVEPVHLADAIAADIPGTYICCVPNQRPPAPGGWKAEAIRRAQAASWRYQELPTFHDAMVTMPRELASLLLQTI